MAESYEKLFASTYPIIQGSHEYILGNHPEDMPFIGRRYDEGLNGNRILLVRNFMEIRSDAVSRIGMENWYDRDSSKLSQEDREDLDLSSWYRSEHTSSRVLVDTLETALGDGSLIENLAIMTWNKIPVSRNEKGGRVYPLSEITKSSPSEEKALMAERRKFNYLCFQNTVDILRPDLILFWGLKYLDWISEQNADIDYFNNILDIPLKDGDVHTAGFIQMYAQSYSGKDKPKKEFEYQDDRGGYWVDNTPIMGLSGIEAFCVSMEYDRNHYRFYR